MKVTLYPKNTANPPYEVGPFDEVVVDATTIKGNGTTIVTLVAGGWRSPKGVLYGNAKVTEEAT